LTSYVRLQLAHRCFSFSVSRNTKYDSLTTSDESRIIIPKTAIPANTMNSARFREIIEDRIRISIEKEGTKKSAFFYHFLLTIVWKYVIIRLC
jgi:hypothetical protein